MGYLYSGAQYESFGKVTAGSDGTDVVASASANVKGAFTQLIASTGFDYKGVLIESYQDTYNERFLVDLAVGGSGSEIVIAENLLVNTLRHFAVVPVMVPLIVPAGSRLSARCQSATGSATVVVSGMGFGSGWASPLLASHRVLMAEQTFSTTLGELVDCGASANTKGAWVQVITATDVDYAGLVAIIGLGTDEARNYFPFLIDIGIGGSGSEIVLIPNLQFTTGYAAFSSIVSGYPMSFGPFPCSIPAGTRVAVRGQTTTTDANDRDFYIALYLIPA